MRPTQPTPNPAAPLLGERAGAALIAYDGSVEARAALEQAAALLAPGSAVVLTVWRGHAQVAAAARAALPDEIIRVAVARMDAGVESVARATAEEGATRARELGLDAIAATERCDAATATAIVRVADELEAAAIVLGTHGIAGARPLLAGSVTRAVASRTTRPLLIARTTPAGRHRAGEAHFLGRRSWSI